jgi:hypothetical protein
MAWFQEDQIRTGELPRSRWVLKVADNCDENGASSHNESVTDKAARFM